jgi:dipeptidyl aminopeptidase/acylaminoacyl peptidase
MKTPLPAGTWPSPLSPDALAGGTVRIGFPMFGEDGSLTYLEQRSAEGGRVVVVAVRDGALEDLLPAPFSARTKVHEYGGASHLILPDGRLLFVNAADQQLWLVPPGGAPEPLTRDTGRFGAPVWDAARRRIVAVTERHADGRVDNGIAAIDLDSGVVTPLLSGRDFYADPAPSQDGRELAFLAWDLPDMPWDAAAVYVATLDDAGSPVEVHHLAGSDQASAQQPTWSPDGTLFFGFERDGYWNLHARTPTGVRCVAPMRAELGGALWLIGTRCFAFVSDDEVVATAFSQGRSSLISIRVSDGIIRTITEELPHVAQLAARGAEIACVSGWAGSGSALIRVDAGSGRLTPIRDVYDGWLSPEDTALAEPVTFPTGPTGDEVAHGFFYAPENALATVTHGELPPLIVLIHGGPTGACVPTFSPTVQFFTTRGYAVLDVNYRGSTGFGRPFRDRLRGGWGVLDVEDAVAGARAMADAGRVDGRRMIIRGGSAGGFTVLQAMVDHDVFAIGSCHYGVSDIEALTHETHKFESRYDRALIGPYPERRDLFIARSPIHHVDRIQRPVVFFQGLEDPVVPPNQTERMADMLRERGIDVEYHGYAGEGHGFRRADTIRAVLGAELAFFDRVFAAGR